jgi:hypothetical protein
MNDNDLFDEEWKKRYSDLTNDVGLIIQGYKISHIWNLAVELLLTCWNSAEWERSKNDYVNEVVEFLLAKMEEDRRR